VVRERILDGRMAAGADLPQRQLSEDLSFSPSVVGEALRMLAREGLVEEAAPGVPARVAGGACDVVIASFAVREVLDGLAARLAALNRGSAAGRRCREALEAQRVALDIGDRARFLRADLRFHLALADGSANSVLRAHLAALDRTARSVAGLAEGELHEALRQHELILAAVCCGQAERAEQLARGHVRTVAEALLINVDTNPEVPR